jgi:hypothetical protein
VVDDEVELDDEPEVDVSSEVSVVAVSSVVDDESSPESPHAASNTDRARAATVRNRVKRAGVAAPDLVEVTVMAITLPGKGADRSP